MTICAPHARMVCQHTGRVARSLHPTSDSSQSVQSDAEQGDDSQSGDSLA